MNYEQYINERQEAFKELPIFFAYNNEQFKEGMEKYGLTEDDTDKIYALGNGGFYRKDDADKIKAWCEDDKLADLMKDPEFAEDAFYYELCNHEFAYNWEGAYDVVNCFYPCKYEEDKPGRVYLREAGCGDETIEAYGRAVKRYFKDANENGWI